VVDAALDFTKKEVATSSETDPQVVLARFVTADDLHSMVLSSPAFISIETPPMALVILRGDFAYTPLGTLVGGDTPPAKSKYIAYIFDLWAGLPTSIMTSPNGSHFRQALADMSLPTPELPMVVAPTIDPSTKTLHYGEVAPGTVTTKESSDAASSSGQFNYGTVHSLVGATDYQVGRFAEQYAVAQRMMRSGVPEAVLVRSVRQEELGTIGVICPGVPATFEEPPLRLVILKGDFDFNQANLPGTTAQHVYQPAKYVAYVFDEWAASPAFLNGSVKGGLYRAILPSADIADDYPGQVERMTANAATVCPTPEPGSKLHYGKTPPTPTQP